MTPRVMVVNCPHCGQEVACMPTELVVEMAAGGRRLEVHAVLRGEHARCEGQEPDPWDGDAAVPYAAALRRPIQYPSSVGIQISPMVPAKQMFVGNLGDLLPDCKVDLDSPFDYGEGE